MEEPEGNLSETLDRVFGIIARRRWWVLLSAATVAIGTIGFLSRLPNRYSSEATLVMQQQVLQRYVLSSAATANAEMVEAMTRQVLSRTHLLSIINQFGLYPKLREGKITSERIVEVMRKDIDIQSLDPRTQADFNAFKITFTTDDPLVAQVVANRLTQLFIDENLKARESQAASTSTFLKEQLDAAKQNLAQQEQRLREFKARHPGELAEQQPTNVAALTDLRIQLQNTRSTLGRAQQQRTSLHSAASGILTRLQSERTALLGHYTQRHPDVIKKDIDIAAAETVLRVVKNDAAGSEKPMQLPAAIDPILADVARQVEANGREVDDLSKQEGRLRADLAQYQARLNVTPVREQEVSGIQRDYEMFKQQYTDLLNRQQQSQLATNLEESRASLQFRLIDPPTLPEKPSSPKRLQFALGGLAGGILFGFAVAFLRDGTDRSFHSEKSVKQRFKLPLVIAVPLLLSPSEERARIWKRGFEWAAGSVMTLAVAAAEFYVYRHG